MKSHILVILLICLVLTSAYRFYGETYQSQTAQQKMDQLWTEITDDQTLYGWYSPITVAGLFLEDMKPTFDFYSDQMPEGRKKLIHTVGAVAQAEFLAEPGNPYSGIFQGASNVIVRFSTGKEADSLKDPRGNFTPAMGIKLLRDGVPSANLVAMLGVDGQDSWNPFRYQWSNHIANPKSLALKLLAKKFSEATPYVGRIGLKTWAKYDQTGKLINNSELKFPFKLIFRPSSKSYSLFPDYYTNTLTNQLKTIEVGTILFDVFAEEEPKDLPRKIGTLKTKSNFVVSKFGDRDLFFQHNYMEDDLKLHPNWKAAVDVDPPILEEIMKEIHS